jgi:hypothetical protein
MSIHDCADCVKLWQAYFRAVTEHTSLRLQQQLAISKDDPEASKRLQGEIERAEQAMRDAKQQINQHDASRHPESRPL